MKNYEREQSMVLIPIKLEGMKGSSRRVQVPRKYYLPKMATYFNGSCKGTKIEIGQKITIIVINYRSRLERSACQRFNSRY